MPHRETALHTTLVFCRRRMQAVRQLADRGRRSGQCPCVNATAM